MRKFQASISRGEPPEMEGFRPRKGTSCGSTSLTGEPINDDLKQHAAGVEDWGYRDHVQALHEWAERFNREFRLGLQTPAIRLERLSSRCLGTYQPGRNGFGLRHEITLNTRYLDQALAKQLETLLHEELHQWQALYGKSGRGGYHNREFRQKAGVYGLVVDERGHHLGIEMGRFTMLLAQHGVDMATLRIPEEEPLLAARTRRGDSKLKKWSCGCTNVRCAVQLAASCRRCGGVFQEAAPAW